MAELKREWPLCTIFLVVGALLCHTLVLVGNIQVSSAMKAIGASTGGWSNVGIGLSTALQGELDEVMANVTEQLTDTIEKVMKVQEQVDNVLGTFGIEVDEQMEDSVSLLQSGENVEVTAAGVIDGIMKAFEVLPHFQDCTKLLDDFMTTAKPVLYQVGDWIESFADKIQAGIEAFGNTVDVVTKLFDQIQAQIKGGTGDEEMLDNTFNLFDIEHTGFVTIDGLRTIADLYAIPAVAGAKAQSLVEKYDENGDHQLNMYEMANFAEDETVPKIMAVVLRAYAKRLSEVSGRVGSAKMRDEVAKGVVAYLQLVASKNITKVGWIAERLTNGSIPEAFTADLMAELALAKDDPNVLTTADVGGMVMGAMLELNSSYVMFCVDLMSDPEFWDSEGLNPDEQPKVIEQVTNWTLTGPNLFKEMKATLKAIQLEAGNTSLAEVDSEALLQTMPAAARRLTAAAAKKHHQQKTLRKMQKRLETFKSPTSKHLLQQLLGGVAATDGVPSSADRALKSGVPAVPATLEFAKFLSWNASRDSAAFTKMCMDYTAQSSGPVDGFNTQISGMVKKTSSFIDMLKERATRAGIDKMAEQVLEFATKGVEDIQKVVLQKVIEFVNKTIGGVDGGVQLSLRQNVSNFSPSGTKRLSLLATDAHSGRQMYSMHQQIRQHGLQLLYGNALQLPGGVDVDEIKDAAKDLFEQLVAKGADSFKAADWKTLAESDQVVEILDKIKIPGLTSDLLSGLDVTAFDSDSNEEISLDEFTGGLTDKDTLKAIGASLAGGAMQKLVPSPIWNEVVTVLRQLTNILPTAIEILKKARTEVSGVSSKLGNIFKNFKATGPKIFDQVAALNSMCWTAYYVLFVPMFLGILFYGFYASGWFGGPAMKDEEEYPPPEGFRDRVAACYRCCCNCYIDYQDTECCLWTLVLTLQVIVLIIFIVAILLTILAGVKAFITAGCSQVFIINDDKVCTETMNGISKFLPTFYVGEVPTSLDFICDVQNLKTCQTITAKMQTSTIYTVVGSFAATLFSFELILNTAMLHERTRMRRMNEKLLREASKQD